MLLSSASENQIGAIGVNSGGVLMEVWLVLGQLMIVTVPTDLVTIRLMDENVHSRSTYASLWVFSVD